MENNIIPYIGPRSYEIQDKELFFGRDYETRELCSRIIAHSVVLCYAQSGAGKTSLINAGVIPRLEDEDFDILPVARVSGRITKEIDPKNIYMFNALLHWSSNLDDPEILTNVTMYDFLKRRMEVKKTTDPLLIIFDQFEELITNYQERWTERKNFFEQVVECLSIPRIRIVFVMREDYIAYLDPYISLFPNKMSIRFRLERMKREAAISAIVCPVEKTNKQYAPDVPEYLVDELLKVKVNTATGETITVPGEYIEPVQLQVVCQSLWAHLPESETVITKKYIQEVGSVEDALREFYDHAMSELVTSKNEKQIRTWFERQLITPTGTRGTVFRGPKETGGIRNDVLDELQSKYLIRAEWRAGGQWYELTHDSLIKAVQDSNRHFFDNIKALADQHHQKGIVYFNQKDYNKAIIEFDKTIALDNEYKWAYENKSLALNELGRNDEALDVINEVINMYPDDGWAYSQRGKIYNDIKEYRLALKDINKAIKMGFNENWIYGNKSYAHDELKEHDEALDAINKAIEIDPNYGWGYGQRGKIYNDLREYEKAIKDIDKALSLGFKENWIYANKAFAYNELDENIKALEAINKALEIDPNYSWAYGLRGKIYNDMKEFKKAWTDLKKATDLNSGDRWVYANKSYVLTQLGDNEEALKAINKALEIDPYYSYAYARRGAIYIDMQQYDKALPDLERALELDDNDKSTYGNLSYALNQLGNDEKALEAINQALNIDPAYAWAYGQRGKVYIDLKQYDKALIDINRAIELGNHENWLYGNLSLVLNELGQNEKALEAINQALKIDPNDQWSHNQREKIMKDMGKK